jgi:hypothetical protein
MPRLEGFFCETCGSPFIRTSKQFICCSNGCGKLKPVPDNFDANIKRAVRLSQFPDNTPYATHVDHGWYKVAGYTGDFRAVRTAGPYIGKDREKVTAEKCPSDCIVAIVGDEPVVFRLSKKGRKEHAVTTP